MRSRPLRPSRRRRDATRSLFIDAWRAKRNEALTLVEALRRSEDAGRRAEDDGKRTRERLARLYAPPASRMTRTATSRS